MRHSPRKRFGQHFLHDPSVIARILAAIDPSAEDRLVEIGPGQGALTKPLLARARRVDVVEIDRDLARGLLELPGLEPLGFELPNRDGATGSGAGGDKVEPWGGDPQGSNWVARQGGLTVHCADALTFDYRRLLDHVEPSSSAPGTAPPRLRVVGNLPYNISTPLIFRLLSQREAIADMHFMLQREVVERMVANPGSRTYGRLSVMTQLRCACENLFTVGAGAFRPPPKVASAVVRLHVRPKAAVTLTDEAGFAGLVTHLFSQRRKTLRASLKGRLQSADLQSLDIAPEARVEQLDLAALARIANRITELEMGHNKI